MIHIFRLSAQPIKLQWRVHSNIPNNIQYQNAYKFRIINTIHRWSTLYSVDRMQIYVYRNHLHRICWRLPHSAANNVNQCAHSILHIWLNYIIIIIPSQFDGLGKCLTKRIPTKHRQFWYRPIHNVWCFNKRPSSPWRCCTVQRSRHSNCARMATYIVDPTHWYLSYSDGTRGFVAEIPS